jgi:hypothetical protein
MATISLSAAVRSQTGKAIGGRASREVKRGFFGGKAVLLCLIVVMGAAWLLLHLGSFAIAGGILLVSVAISGLSVRGHRPPANDGAAEQDRAAVRRLREQLLAGSEPQHEGFLVDVAYRPAGEAGGDFYRTVSLEDGSLLVILGDVSGEGVDAAKPAAIVLENMDNEMYRSPASLLAHLNRAVMGRTAGEFITACCARFYPDGHMVFANAGHLAPFVGGEQPRLEIGLPLGISAKAAYREIEIKAGGPVTFVSNGVVEARDLKGKLLGFERTALLARWSSAVIADAAQRWGQEEDITVVRVTPRSLFDSAKARGITITVVSAPDVNLV